MWKSKQARYRTTDARGDDKGCWHQVHSFSPENELLVSFAKAGVAGDGFGEFSQRSDVLVAPDDSIFVDAGHGSEGMNRVMKSDAGGNFIKTWGMKRGYLRSIYIGDAEVGPGQIVKYTLKRIGAGSGRAVTMRPLPVHSTSCGTVLHGETASGRAA